MHETKFPCTFKYVPGTKHFKINANKFGGLWSFVRSLAKGATSFITLRCELLTELRWEMQPAN